MFSVLQSVALESCVKNCKCCSPDFSLSLDHIVKYVRGMFTIYKPGSGSDQSLIYSKIRAITINAMLFEDFLLNHCP